jgi:hypothetical protein
MLARFLMDAARNAGIFRKSLLGGLKSVQAADSPIPHIRVGQYGVNAMNTVAAILIGCCIAVVLANIVVCFRVAKCDSFEPHQKYIQCILIWLLPIAGAGVAYVFTREPKMSVRGYPAENSSYDIGDVAVGNGSGDYLLGEHHVD